MFKFRKKTTQKLTYNKQKQHKKKKRQSNGKLN